MILNLDPGKDGKRYRRVRIDRAVELYGTAAILRDTPPGPDVCPPGCIYCPASEAATA